MTMYDAFQGTFALLKLLSRRPINGRKKMQKISHLLQVQRAAIPFPFTYHHYGPYSPALQETLDRLVESHMVEEVHSASGYVYRLTDDGESFLKRLEADGYDLTFDEGLLNILLEKPATFLEVLSTYAYFREQGLSSEQAVQKVKLLKAHLSAYIPEVQAFYTTFFEKQA